MKLLGCELLTDWKPLEETLETLEKDSSLQFEFEKKFPGLLSAVFTGLRVFLDKDKRARPKRITYWNFRVQVWPPENVDADPSTPVRVIPEGVLDRYAPV